MTVYTPSDTGITLDNGPRQTGVDSFSAALHARNHNRQKPGSISESLFCFVFFIQLFDVHFGNALYSIVLSIGTLEFI